MPTHDASSSVLAHNPLSPQGTTPDRLIEYVSLLFGGNRKTLVLDGRDSKKRLADKRRIPAVAGILRAL
jgi:hypothetical protein